MKEVEVKARIEDKDDIIQELQFLGCILTDPFEQKDEVFVPTNIIEAPTPIGVPVMRFRLRTKYAKPAGWSMASRTSHRRRLSGVKPSLFFYLSYFRTETITIAMMVVFARKSKTTNSTTVSTRVLFA